MAEALKIVSVQRGHDPRAFVLAAFGGAGPLHAAALADELGIGHVICPPIPGAFSALGLVGSDLKRDYVRTVYTTTATADPAALEAAFAALEREGAAHARPRRRGAGAPPLRAQRRCPLRAPVLRAVGAGRRRACSTRPRSPPWPTPSTTATADLRPRQPRRAGAARQRARHRDRRHSAADHRHGTGAAPAPTPSRSRRPVWFRGTGAVQATVYDRRRMPAGLLAPGPAVIELLESTILVPPAWQARDGRQRLRASDATAQDRRAKQADERREPPAPIPPPSRSSRTASTRSPRRCASSWPRPPIRRS